jgi:hypothetical protein
MTVLYSLKNSDEHHYMQLSPAQRIINDFEYCIGTRNNTLYNCSLKTDNTQKSTQRNRYSYCVILVVPSSNIE